MTEYLVTVKRNNGVLFSYSWTHADNPDEAKINVRDHSLLNDGWMERFDIEPIEQWIVEDLDAKKLKDNPQLDLFKEK